jgi:hypothetical protein
LLAGDSVERPKIDDLIGSSEPSDVILRHYYPENEPASISIPTVHIMGQNYPFLRQVIKVAGLCSSSSMAKIANFFATPRSGRQQLLWPRQSSLYVRSMFGVFNLQSSAMAGAGLGISHSHSPNRPPSTTGLTGAQGT